jgi:hypothetical protein
LGKTSRTKNLITELVFLFELLAGATPRGKQKIREAVFGPDWSAVTATSEVWPTPAIVLARLTSDPHVNWHLDICASAVDRCLDVVAEYYQQGNEVRFTASTTPILGALFAGEPAMVRERLQRLADRWAMAGIPRLSLEGTPVADLSPLAGLTNLQSLNLAYTSVVDLSPLARLANLQSLDLFHTLVVDLSPLAGLTNLRFLTLEKDVLGVFSGPRIIDDEIAKLKARLPGLEVRFDSAAHRILDSIGR